MKEKTEHFKFYQNRECEYFPCHSTGDEDNFNCLFCYCPLYALGRHCGGAFSYTKNGVKDCSKCLFPHRRENYDKVVGRFREIVEAMRRLEAANGETPDAKQGKE